MDIIYCVLFLFDNNISSYVVLNQISFSAINFKQCAYIYNVILCVQHLLKFM